MAMKWSLFVKDRRGASSKLQIASHLFMRNFVLFVSVLLVLGTAVSAHAQLPEGNLITNPCFQSDPTTPSLAGWENPSGRWVGRTGEEKNPSPCNGFNGDGTAVKLGPERFNGAGEPGTTDYLYQVVKADETKQILTFSLYYIAVRVDTFQVNIYGSDSPEGEWALVWTPVSLQRGTHEPFEQLEQYETKLERGYAYYKVEFQGQFTEGLGMKVTGVYFAVSGESVVVPTNTPGANPTETPALATAVSAQPSPTAQPALAEPTEIAAVVQETAVFAAPATSAPPQPSSNVTPPDNSRVLGRITAVLFIALALFVAAFGIKKYLQTKSS